MQHDSVDYLNNNSILSSEKRRAWSWVGLGAAIALYVALSIRHIWCPGLGYDEVMWASVAIRDPDSSWTAWRIGRWPVLLALPYIGALKGYIYIPILALFGTSPLSIRLPMILLGAAGIAMTFAAARRSIGITSAVLVAFFLAINPEIVQRLRHDLGPAALDFVLRAACLLLLLRYAEKERPCDAVLFWFLAIVGVWQKLTFIWYINAYVFAFVLLQGRAWVIRRRSTGVVRALLPHALSYLAVVAWVGWVYVTFHVAEVQASLGSGAGTPPIVRIVTLGQALGLFFQGIETIKIFHDPFFVPKAATFFLFLLLVFVAAGILRGLREVFCRATKGIPFRGIVVLAALATAIQLTITLPADKVWHRLSLEPFVTWLAVDGILTLTTAVASVFSRATAVRAIFTAVTCLIAFGGIAYYAQIHLYLEKKLCTPAVHHRLFNRAIQTPAIWRLLDIVASSNRRFIFLDWGMRNQALIVTRQPERMIEYAWLSQDSAEAKIFAQKFITTDNRDAFVLHGPEYTCIPATRNAFFNLAKTMQIPLRQSSVIEEDGSIAFEIWEVKR